LSGRPATAQDFLYQPWSHFTKQWLPPFNKRDLLSSSADYVIRPHGILREQINCNPNQYQEPWMTCYKITAFSGVLMTSPMLKSFATPIE
jgi:hypothetical protein